MIMISSWWKITLVAVVLFASTISTDSFRARRLGSFRGVQSFRGGLRSQQVENGNDFNPNMDTNAHAILINRQSIEHIKSSPINFKKIKKYVNLSFGEKFINKVLSVVIEDKDAVKVMSKTLNSVFWVYLFLSTAGTLGLDIKPFLSLLSIGGLTVGFALRDLLTTTFTGMFLLFSKPFIKGSVITTNGFRGEVLDIDWQFVRLADPDTKHTVMVPLSLVYAAPITVEKF